MTDPERIATDEANIYLLPFDVEGARQYALGQRHYDHEKMPDEIGAPDYWAFQRFTKSLERLDPDRKIYATWREIPGEEPQLLGLTEFEPLGDPAQRTFSVGVEVLPKYRRQGLGTTALGGLMKHLYDSGQADKLRARVGKKNEPSQRMVSRLGFQAVNRDMTAIIYEHGPSSDSDDQPDEVSEPKPKEEPVIELSFGGMRLLVGV